MKHSFAISFALAFALVAVSVVSCREWETPRFEDPQFRANTTIGALRGDYYTEKPELTIADDIRIAGRVISSTLAGNFYNTVFIDDGTGAVELMVGRYDLDAVYHPGQIVAVRARGLAVGWRDGVMQMGLPPEAGSYYATEYFRHPVVADRYLTLTRDVAPVTPVETTIGALSEDMCGRLVRIAGLAFDDETGGLAGKGGDGSGLADEAGNGGESSPATWAETEPIPRQGYAKFRSSPTDSITVSTSGYASFARMPIPRETVTLVGILFYGKGGSSKDHFIIKLRDEKDIEF